MSQVPNFVAWLCYICVMDLLQKLLAYDLYKSSLSVVSGSEKAKISSLVEDIIFDANNALNVLVNDRKFVSGTYDKDG